MSKDKSTFEYQFKDDYQSDWDIHRNYAQTFDAYEAMLLGYVWDSVSNSIDASKMTDSYAATLAKERADRVMAKLPDGATEPMGKADQGKAMFMDILRQKWIYPNANAQRPFQEKLNLWQLYSSVYGYMPMFYDWNANSVTGYIGPDCWLWNPRNLVPQQGRVSIEDMDYVTALTWYSKKAIQNFIDNAKPDDGWDTAALKELASAAEKTTETDRTKDTVTTRTRTPQNIKKGICLATRYEAGPDGEWVTFAPDHGYIEVRRLKNPHKNGRIPFVIKYSQPLFDSFYGLGDFQRSKSLQFGRDGLRNFYFKGVKMNLIPPIVANANGTLKHTLDYREGGVMLETLPNSIRRLETSTAGLSTYQAAMSDLTGSLLSQFGTQNASLPGAEALNPTQGKTPAAISMYSDKEATRDGAEIRHLETAIEQLTEGFYSLIVNIGTESIPLTLFTEDIEEIVKAGLTDVEQIFDRQGMFKNFQQNATQTGGVLTLNPKELKGIEYRFKINPNTTALTNQQQQAQQFEDLMTDIGKFQNIFKDDSRVSVNWGAIMQAREEMSGIKGASQFITQTNGPSPQEQQLQQQLQQTQQELQQAQTSKVTMPNGSIHESADLGKVLLGLLGQPGTEDTVNAILQAMSLPPIKQVTPEVPPTTISSGHTFTDPHVAAAAEAINNHPSLQPTPSEALETSEPMNEAPDAEPAPEGAEGATEPAGEVPDADEAHVASNGHVFKDKTIANVASAMAKR